MQLQVGRSLDRMEGNHDSTATLGDCCDGRACIAQAGGMRRNWHTPCQWHTTLCVLYTWAKEKGRSSDRLLLRDRITWLDYLRVEPWGCIGIRLLRTVKCIKLCTPWNNTSKRKAFLNIKQLYFVTVCQKNNQNKSPQMWLCNLLSGATWAAVDEANKETDDSWCQNRCSCAAHENFSSCWWVMMSVR